jgi:excisionase family DNA binding protein
VPTALPQLLTVKQAAETLAVSQKLVRKLLKGGQLQGARVGGAVRVVESGLHDYVERNRTGPAAAVLPSRPTPRRRRQQSHGFRFLDPSRW